ncbi:hypothetical protein KC343_g3582 [Hortaea werneckii]|uniref:Actin cortical patch SUR7/pH-response regulator PalI n=1 Tax=Hortaea werneckii TaxID=91943 RepID=A0A3M7G7V4_HORWE|nr:hypothetical protein KC352_g5351 [Hortaea werneckii]KAI7568659.1 hypothetical protein KC317_g3995 [Hortaea werneckii]KAI7627020.1 hypothetical protein KC346_g954 [Hortaea werneckii]KAI7632263.1 hypothetical protein KC343_g3582 [Hortaea werneckii]KAI7668129.1 hypothetical protein KC319_g6492 [Hortaea werneckii]
MWFAVLSIARKFYKSRNGKNSLPGSPIAPGAQRSFGAPLFLSILAAIVATIAMVLAILAVFAGNKPSNMTDYYVFRLNTSRIGQNLIEEVDNKIMSVKFDLKRELPAPAMATATSIVTPRTQIISAPTTLITMAPRGTVDEITEGVGEFTSKAGSLKSDAGSAISSKASAVESAATSKASAVKSAAESKANSAMGSLQTKVVEAINDAYDGILDELDLSDFYDVHISSTCKGTYKYKDGKNETVSVGKPAKDDDDDDKKVYAHIDSCEKHSALDPMGLIRVLYWAGIALTVVSVLLGWTAVFMKSRKMAIFNCLATLPAFLFLVLASAITHGIGMGAAKFINFIGGEIGVRGYKGGKFIALTWACTALLLANGLLWGFLVVLRGRAEKSAHNVPEYGSSSGIGLGSRSFRSKRDRPDRTSQIIMEPVARPPPSHDAQGQQWI